jgi:alpha-galactosidase
MGQYANSWRSGPDHRDDWTSTASIIEHNVGLSKYAGPGAWNDPDFLMTGGQGCSDDPDKRCPGMSDEEYRTEFGMWCLLAAPLLVVTDVRTMTDIQKELLLNTELIAVNQDKLGHQGDRIGFFNCSTNEKTACQIWAKNLTNNSVALGLYNSVSISIINVIVHKRIYPRLTGYCTTPFWPCWCLHFVINNLLVVVKCVINIATKS